MIMIKLGGVHKLPENPTASEIMNYIEEYIEVFYDTMITPVGLVLQKHVADYHGGKAEREHGPSASAFLKLIEEYMRPMLNFKLEDVIRKERMNWEVEKRVIEKLKESTQDVIERIAKQIDFKEREIYK